MREKVGEWKRRCAPEERIGVQKHHEKANIVCVEL